MSKQPAQPDDDALSWAGDDDPTLDVRERRGAGETAASVAPVAAASQGSTVAAPAIEESEGVGVDAPRNGSQGTREQMSSVALVMVSVLGGILLLYTVGWFVSVQRIGTGSEDGLRTLMFTVGQVLAVAAPPLWFAASFLATRGRSARWFVLALVVGALVLIPWPFVIGAR